MSEDAMGKCRIFSVNNPGEWNAYWLHAAELISDAQNHTIIEIMDINENGLVWRFDVIKLTACLAASICAANVLNESLTLDEADKKMRFREGGRHGNNSNFGILGEWNALLSGDPAGHNKLIYLLGAFSEIREEKRNIKEKTLGFNTQIQEGTKQNVEITMDDLVKYGAPTELLSRLHLFNANDLRKEDYYQIALNSRDGVIQRMIDKGNLFDIKVIFFRDVSERKSR